MHSAGSRFPKKSSPEITAEPSNKPTPCRDIQHNMLTLEQWLAEFDKLVHIRLGRLSLTVIRVLSIVFGSPIKQQEAGWGRAQP